MVSRGGRNVANCPAREGRSADTRMDIGYTSQLIGRYRAMMYRCRYTLSLTWLHITPAIFSKESWV